MEEIISRYGLALYSIALEENKIVELQSEAKTVKKILKENSEYCSILNSAFLPMEKRISLVDETFKNIDIDLKNLIKVVVNNSRSTYLIDILQSFNSYCNEYRGVDEGIVYSISPLDESIIQGIEEKISKKENVKVELINKIDPSLIGGVKVVIHDHIYDGSIKNTLELMKQKMKK